MIAKQQSFTVRYLIYIYYIYIKIWKFLLDFLISVRCQDNSHKNLVIHWGRVMHICVSKLAIIGSDNGLSPGRRQAITWTNADLLSIGPLETNFSEVGIEIQNLSFMKMHLKTTSPKWQPFCLGFNVLNGLFNDVHPCSWLKIGTIMW